MAEINITTVRDMIDSSFYEEDTNTVNFKMIQNVLYILARQLRILQRHVSLERARRLYMLQGEIKVTEIKVHSKVPKDSSPEGRDGKKGGGSPENKGGPGDQGEKRGLGEKGSKGGQGSKGGPGEKGSKGGQGAQVISGRKEDKGSPDTTGSKGSPKGRQGTPQDQGLQENQGAKGGQGTADSKKKPGGQTKGDEAGEEGGVKQSSDKSATKSSKGKTTDPSAADDATTLKAATGKSQGKSGDRKGGKKGDDDDMDVLQEKLLVVSRTSSTDGGRGTVATLDQFRNMVSQIRELQAKFGLEDTLDTEALRGALHKETSLSHPIAAVNMSSRLEAAERKLAAIMPIVTDLAEKTPGIDMDAAYDDIFLRPLKTSSSRTGAAGSDEDDQEAATAEGPITGPKQESDEESLEMDAPDAKFALLDPSIKGVTHIEMNEGLEEIYDVVMKIITGASKAQYNAADGAMKRTQKVDARLDQAMKVGDAFTKLDTSVDEYTEKITDLDGRLTTQMTSYQDELMQMQHNLESGLDTMAEVLAAPTEDAAAIAELNGYFTNFQFDIERTLERQQELRTLQMEYSANLDELKQKINELQQKKSTRDEVTDALSDKAGIAALNGLVTMEQYQAVRGDFEKRIGHAYDKFNNKEITWQKAIDDLVRELNEKTDLHQLVYLNKEIQKYLTLMRKYLDDMLALVGDIDPITTKRKVERSDNCLSCGTQFNAETDEDLSETRPPVIGAETAPAKEDLTKKYRKCYPGYPVTHPIDPRSLICHHYCGTTAPTERESAFKMQISELNPNHGTKVGTDAKVHLTDEHKKPCMPCNVPHIIPASPPDSIRFNVLVPGPIETLSNDETAARGRGIIK